MSKKKPKTTYVWCAEDDKYGLQAVYATKKAADKDYGPNGSADWVSGYGGVIMKRKINQ